MANQTRFWLHSTVTPLGRSREISLGEHCTNALLAVGLALLLMLLFDPWAKMSQNPYLLFFGAVVMSGWRTGFLGGLIATGLSAIVSQYFFREPRYSFVLDLPSSVSLLLFILECVVVSGICDSLRQRNQLLDRSLSQLKNSEDCYRRILETAGEGVWIVNERLRTEYVNPRLSEILGYSAAEMLGHSIFEFISPEFQKVAWQQIKRYRKGQQEQFDFCYQHQNGSKVWAIVSTNTIYDSQGNFVGALGMLTDITERKQMEESLQSAHQQIQDILESITDGFYTLDRQWRFSYVNHQTEEILGRSRQELLGQPIWDIFPQGKGSIFDQTFQRAIQEQIPLVFETVGVVHLERHYEVHVNPLQNGLGVYFQDITARKQVEAALRQSETILNAFLASSPIGMAFLDHNLRYVYANEALASINGIPLDKHLGRTFGELLPDWEQEITPVMQGILASQQPLLNVELSGETYPAGVQHHTLINYFPVCLPDGEQLGLGVTAMNITELKQAEAALRRSEEQFRQLADAMPQIVWIADASGQVKYLNQQWFEYTGLPREEDCHHSNQIAAVIHPDEQGHVQQHWELALAARTPYQAEFRLRRGSDGCYRWFLGRAVPIRNEQGQIVQWYGTSTDIDDRKQSEVALRQSEERFRIAQDLSLDAFTILQSIRNTAGEIIDFEWNYVNPMAAQTLQHPVEQLLGRRLLEVLPGNQTNSELFARYVQVVETGQPHDIELRYESEGIVGWFRNMAVKLNDGVAISFSNITDRKQSEVALRRSEDRYRTLANAVPQLMWVNQTDGTVEFFNQRWQEYTGIQDLAAEVGLWINVVHPEDFQSTTNIRNQAIESGTAYEVECRLKRHDGTYRWHLARVVPLKDEAQQVLHWFGTAMDIHDLKQAQAALQQSEAIAKARAAELEIFMETVPAAVWIAHDPQCHHMTANRAAYELVSLPSGAVVTATPADGTYPFPFKIQQNGQNVPLEDLPMQRAGRIGEAVEGECDFVFENGEVRAIWGRAVPLLQEDGQVRGVIGAFLDMSDRKKAEQERERLLERERLAREAAEAANRIKDEFLAVLSHELRSPLNPILGWAKLLRTRSFDATATARALETIERNANLQTQLIDDLLDVSRILRGKMTLNVAPVNLVATIHAALETVQLAAETKQIQLQTQLATEGVYISGDGGRLQQIIWNLLSNAIKFTPQGGRVEIRLTTVGTIAQIQVQDNGKGINLDFLPYVFDYFRQEDGTTTRKFGGLGLGLAIVRHLTELHGGTVHAESLGEGQGATFTVQLPRLITEITAPVGVNLLLEDLNLNSLRILVVDDEADMRILAQTLLSSYGAEVKVAASAAEALQLFNEFQPKLLISDIGMPEIDGYMLMRLIRRRSPEQGGLIPAIALTAYAGELDQKQALAAGFQKHVVKPVDPTYLVQTIISLIEQSRESVTTITPQSPGPQSEESKSESSQSVPIDPSAGGDFPPA